MGISGKLGVWLHSFLSNRQQSIAVKGSSSKPSLVLSSMPQGTVLGPIFFLVLISDIVDNTTSRVASFADDTRVTGIIKNASETQLLQKDLETIHVYFWQAKNNMLFNESKFELMRYEKDTRIMAQTIYTGPDGQDISAKPFAHNLGVALTDCMCFHDHINQLCQSVSGVLF